MWPERNARSPLRQGGLLIVSVIWGLAFVTADPRTSFLDQVIPRAVFGLRLWWGGAIVVLCVAVTVGCLLNHKWPALWRVTCGAYGGLSVIFFTLALCELLQGVHVPVSWRHVAFVIARPVLWAYIAWVHLDFARRIVADRDG